MAESIFCGADAEARWPGAAPPSAHQLSRHWQRPSTNRHGRHLNRLDNEALKDVLAQGLRAGISPGWTRRSPAWRRRCSRRHGQQSSKLGGAEARSSIGACAGSVYELTSARTVDRLSARAGRKGLGEVPTRPAPSSCLPWSKCYSGRTSGRVYRRHSLRAWDGPACSSSPWQFMAGRAPRGGPATLLSGPAAASDPLAPKQSAAGLHDTARSSNYTTTGAWPV